MTALDPDALTPEQFAGLLTAVDLRPDGTGGMPAERMAVVNALLAAASPEVRERLLTEFYAPLVRLRSKVPGYAVSLIKAGVRLRGLDVGGVRPPLAEVTDEHLAELRELIKVGLDRVAS